MKVAAGRGVGQTIGFCRLSSGPRLTLAKDDRRQKPIVCPTLRHAATFIPYSCAPGAHHQQVGKRDRAILLLLARLGLRAGEIVRLRLADLDWEQAGIRVSGKGRRQTLLPLTQERGDAVASYIKDSRPQTAVDTLCIRSRAPFRALANHGAISMIVAPAMRRAGVTCPSRGAAHVLRHSVASSMLRHGASLQEMAGVLRHRCITTTEIYAKVDVVALRQMAQPWPEVKSC